VSAVAMSDPSSRNMMEVSKRWTCEFKNNPQLEKLRQGIACTVEHLCSHPAEKRPITFIDLRNFQIDFETKTLSYVESERWFPAVRERMRLKLKAEGRPDETKSLENDSPRSFEIQGVLYSKPKLDVFTEITTIAYVDDNQQIALLTIIGNGKEAIISSPIAAFNQLNIVHYFGACHPQ